MIMKRFRIHETYASAAWVRLCGARAFLQLSCKPVGPLQGIGSVAPCTFNSTFMPFVRTVVFNRSVLIPCSLNVPRVFREFPHGRWAPIKEQRSPTALISQWCLTATAPTLPSSAFKSWIAVLPRWSSAFSYYQFAINNHLTIPMPSPLPSITSSSLELVPIWHLDLKADPRSSCHLNTHHLCVVSVRCAIHSMWYFFHSAYHLLVLCDVVILFSRK